MVAHAPILVGRDQELATIGQLIRDAKAGRGGTLFLVGESGIGKSRLAAEAAELGFEAGARLLRGRGSSIGPIVPFRPLTEALMSLLRAGGLVGIEELGPYRPLLAPLVPDWGPPTVGLDRGSPVLLAEAMLRLIGLAGRDGGCLLVLDDMQDFDVESLAVVDYLASNMADQPSLLIGITRTGSSPAAELARSAAQRGYGTRLELSRLTATEVHLQAASCLDTDPGGVPAELLTQLWDSSEGVPLLVEELLKNALRDRLLLREHGAWQVRGTLRMRPPDMLTQSVAGRLDQVGQASRELLSLAAVLGRRFPVAVLQAASGLGDRELLRDLHAVPTAELVMPDEQTPDWYAFRHPLVTDSILSLLTPAERRRLTRQAAAAVEAVHPDMPDEWCQMCATLYTQAGDRERAGSLFAEAGRRALTQGAAESAVTLLDQALELLSAGGDAHQRADALASLLSALAEAGMMERTVAVADEIERVGSLLTGPSRARLHTRLAWTAAVAGRISEGLAQVDIARRLLGPDASGQDTAPVDVVAAHLQLDLPGPNRVREAEALAWRAVRAAETAQLPIVACQAWQLLGALKRGASPDEAATCLERALKLAATHDLPIEVIHALIRLGCDDALRDGSLDRLELARREASRVGAVTASYQADVNLALQAILRAEFTEAESTIDRVLAATTRLKLLETARHARRLQVILSAHRGMRRQMERAFTTLREAGGDDALSAPRLHGLARAWCALLEENRPRALQELSLATAAEETSPTIYQPTGRYGVRLLLRVLDGTAGEAEYRKTVAAPISRLRWDRQFAEYASAVLAGRAGRRAAAMDAVAEAMALGRIYPTGRYMGLRLVSEAAIADGWGSPAEWLRSAEEYFSARNGPAVARACRALLRRIGVPVLQHRRGAQQVPSALRTIGVTVREHEILQLLVERLSNREIAVRLHLSPRTVEKHVASLMAKTGQRDRITLGEYGVASL